jgi:hypothetical protein
MKDAYPSNSEKSRKDRKSNETLDAGELLRVITAVKKGDFSVRMPVDGSGIAGKVYDALNDVIKPNDQTAKE